MPPPLHVVITDCTGEDFLQFAQSRGLQSVKCEPEQEGLVCTVPPEELQSFYDNVREEAAKAWQDPESTPALSFDSAFFPASPDRIQPVRQVRGRVAAQLARKKVALPAAYASPGFVFGMANDSK